MRSSRPKVLHAIAQRPLVGHVLAAVSGIGGAVAVVVGPEQEAVVAEVKRTSPQAEVFVQSALGPPAVDPALVPAASLVRR